MKYEPSNADSFRTFVVFLFCLSFIMEHLSVRLFSLSFLGQLMTLLLPVLMMRHRRVPRAKWADHVTANGKHWIEHAPTDPSRPRPPAIGYHLTFQNSLCGMAVTQGQPQQVVNIGLGIKQMKVEPKGISVPDFLESLSHKVCNMSFSY